MQLEGGVAITYGESPPRGITLNSRLSETARSRLSLQRCRSMLGPACELTDAQVLRLRESLYDLANVVFEGRRNEKGLQ